MCGRRGHLLPAVLVLLACDARIDQAGGADQAELRAAPEPGDTACSSERFSSARSQVQCCQDGNRTWHTAVVSPTEVVLARRTLGTPCREADGVGTNCGLDPATNVRTPCAWGPCGAKEEWAFFTTSAGCPADDPTCRVRIFHPESRPGRCGWEVRDIQTCVDALHPTATFAIPYGDLEMCDDDAWQDGTASSPEPYLDQELYPFGFAGTCQYRGCLVGGTPF